MSHTEIWTKENRELHMEVQVIAGQQAVVIEAALFRLMLADLGWMPLTDEATPDTFVTITDS